MFQITSRELIGYDTETKVLASYVYSNLSPVPLPHKWDLQGEDLTISVSYGPLDANLKGTFKDDNAFSGGWRPNPGADESVNIPYDIGGGRIQ